MHAHFRIASISIGFQFKQRSFVVVAPVAESGEFMLLYSVVFAPWLFGVKYTILGENYSGSCKLSLCAPVRVSSRYIAKRALNCLVRFNYLARQMRASQPSLSLGLGYVQRTIERCDVCAASVSALSAQQHESSLPFESRRINYRVGK